MDKSLFDYNERPKQFGKKDFWRQVRRTINGEPVKEDQIDLIIKQVRNMLDLKKSDKLLDLGCGNGALTVKFLPYVSKILGIDRSDYLIKIAKQNFEISNLKFECFELSNYTHRESIHNFNKCLLYGVSSFLEDEIIYSLSEKLLHQNNYYLMFGNIRELKYAENFYTEDVHDEVLKNTKTSMGKWRTRDWYSKLAKKFNADIEFSKMPETFYASKYYFDVVIKSK